MANLAVIGAGAAGISAARELQAAGHDVEVFEARDRPGGRAWTDYSLAPHPVELGAEFLHGDRISTWDWVREFDARTTGEAHRYEMWFALDGMLKNNRQAREYFGTEAALATDLLTRQWQAGGKAETTADHLFDVWSEVSAKPLTAEGRALLENYGAMMVSSDMSTLGTHTYDALNPRDLGLQNWRLLNGYTRLIQRAAANLEIRFETPVSRIRYDESRVSVTAGGAESRFDAAVVTLPLGVLKRGAVEFDPPLPIQKQDAIDRINPGSISKVALRFDRVYWPENLTFIFGSGKTQLWWRPGQGQANEAPVITAFFGGSSAKDLESASREEATELACRELSDMLGESIRGGLVDSRYIAWGAEEHTMMGYSSLPPDGKGLREALAAPVGALHFAGEACSLTHAATVDGAIDSGRVAAAEILAACSPDA